MTLGTVTSRLIWYLRHPRKLRARIVGARPPSERRVVQTKLGSLDAVVFLNEAVGWQVVSDGTYEPHELNALKSLICSDAVCLDVGANIGMYAISFAALVPNGRVVAIEPDRLNLAMLRLNIELNGFNNVEVLPLVLSDVVGSLQFSVSSDGAFSSLKDTGRKPIARTITVESSTIDRLMEEGIFSAVNICKIDVEGAELLVLRGAKTLLRDRSLQPAALLVECNAVNQRAYGYNPRDILDLMNSWNYDANSVTEGGIVRGWPAPTGGEYVLFTPRSPLGKGAVISNPAELSGISLQTSNQKAENGGL